MNSSGTERERENRFSSLLGATKKDELKGKQVILVWNDCLAFFFLFWKMDHSWRELAQAWAWYGLGRVSRLVLPNISSCMADLLFFNAMANEWFAIILDIRCYKTPQEARLSTANEKAQRTDGLPHRSALNYLKTHVALHCTILLVSITKDILGYTYF